MYYNSRQFSNFRGINLLAANGAIRFEDVDVAPTTTSGEYLMYVDGGVLYFDNGSGIVALGAAGAPGSVSWEALYATDNTFNIAGGNGLTFAGAMASANDVITITVDAGSSGDAIQITNLGSGADIKGSSDTWNVTKAGVATFVSLAVTTAANSNSVTVTNNSATSANVFLLTSSGVLTGTGANSFANVTASGLTTGTAFTVIANAATTSVGVVAISATGQTSGSTLLVTGGGANITSGGKVVEVAMGAATTGSGISITTSGIFAGTTTNSILNINATSATTGTAVYVQMNGLTTGVAQLITSSGTMTTTGSLLTLTGNSATTAAGLFRINANGLTSGIGAVIASSATAITGAGRLLRVDHTGATGSTAILSEFASAANDETEILKVTASAALAAGKALHISTAAMTTGTSLYITNTEATLTTGKYIDCYDGAASDFSVAKYGATVIAGNAAGTAALTITAGKVVVTDCDASTFTSADGTASVLIVTNTAGVIAADKAVIEMVANGSGSDADSSVLRVVQDNTGGVSFCVTLKQDDLDVGFINFEGTASADALSPISTHGTPGATTDFVRVAINGTKAWIAVSTNDPTA